MVHKRNTAHVTRFILSLTILSLFFVTCNLLPVTVLAQSPTATPTGKITPKVIQSPTPTLDKKISELKERIATRVAELNLVEKRGFLGEVATISGTKITLVDLQNQTKIIDTDELTKFTKTGGKDSFLSSFSKGDKISAFGLYNKNSRILLARFIEKKQIKSRIFGEIVEIDRKNFVVEVREKSEALSAISIETSTQTSLFKDDKLSKAGFSKIEVGQKIFVVGIPEAKINGERRYTALRIIIFPKPSLTVTPTSTPSAKTTPPAGGPKPQ